MATKDASRLSRRSDAGFFSSAKSFFLPEGDAWAGPAENGYFVDFSVKAAEPRWPAAWGSRPEQILHVWPIQHGLGSLERYRRGEGERWLEAARVTADHL